MTAATFADRLHAATSGSGAWMARCPAHDDKTPSLSISEGDDGRVLVRCFAGCTFDEIISAAGVSAGDLMPPNAAHKAPAPPSKAKTHPTLDAAAGAVLWGLQRDGGAWRETRRDLYRDATGAEVAAVLRFDADGRKEYRPLRAVAGGWQIGDPSGLWPLFRLPELLASDGPLYIAEGEKAAVAGVAAGLCCTTSAHGAKSPQKTDWTPVKGRAVAILPDADHAGVAYAETVAVLCHAAGAASVRIVTLPGLPPKGDIADLDPATVRATVESATATASPWTPPPVQTDPPATVDAVRAALWALAQEKLTATELHRKSAAAVVSWLHGRGRFYHVAGRPDFAGVMFFDAERKLLLPVQGDGFLAWLADCLSVNRSERVFQFCASAVETEGLSDRSTAIEPATYWAATATGCYLSNGPGRMARISADGVSMVDNGTDGVLFPTGATLEPWTLTTPADPFETCSLFRDMATAAPHGRDLFRLWVCALPTDQRTKPPLCLTSSVGGGKTRTVRGVFELFGIPARIAAIVKNGEQDFWATLDGGGLACWDNADTRTDWLPDALAAASTAGTLEKRRLYTDADRVSLKARAWVAITSASPSFAADAGLADRLLVVRLNRRTGQTAETALSDEIARARDAGLSWICHTLARALADRGAVPDGLNARHPDFAALGVRIGRAMGREGEAIAALRAAESDKARFCLENDALGAALLETIAEPFAGSCADLLALIATTDAALAETTNAKKLGKRLAKLWPHLEACLSARMERDGHSKALRYAFKPPQNAEYAGFQGLKTEKSYARENKGTLLKNDPSNPANPANPDPEAFEERAALLEFDGNLTRETAEETARRMLATI